MNTRVSKCQGWLVRTAAAVAFVAGFGVLPSWAQQARATYLGGTLGPGQASSLHQYDTKAPAGRLDTSPGPHFTFTAGRDISLTIPYHTVTALTFGMVPGYRGEYAYPWQSYQQFTSKRHYVLTVIFQDPAGQEQAVALELDKGAARATLERLEARTAKRIDFIHAIACAAVRSPAECGHRTPTALSGLTRVFVEPGPGGDELWAQVAEGRPDLTRVDRVEDASVILKYSGAIVMDKWTQKVMDAGRGEVAIVAEDGPHVVLTFEDVRTSYFEKPPHVNFARAFLEACSTGHPSR